MAAIQSILVFGYGNMTGAMVDGWLASGIPASAITAVDPVRDTSPDGIRLLREVPADETFDLVLLGVKPQLLGQVADDVEPLLTARTILLSVLAGVETASLQQLFPQASGIVRLMPNLAAAYRKSANTLFAVGLKDSQRDMVEQLVERLGATEWLADEELFHAATALAGSGPAFVYRFIDALAVSGAEIGLDPQLAERLAIQMVEGAALLAARSDASPGELARRVASPGGTTEAGLQVLDDGQAIAGLVNKCLTAARDRSEEMAENARKPS